MNVTREQALAVSKRYGIHEQVKLIDQVVREQRVHQLAAALLRL